MRKHGKFWAGFLSGLLLIGITTTAYAAGIMAERSSNRIFVDGTEVQMEAYVINGNNYVKLRDIGEAVGFNVYWDSTDRCVRIESDKPYTGVAPSESNKPTENTPTTGEDLSLAANAAVFNSVFTRDAYNAIRQTMTSGKGELTIAISDENRQDLNTVVSHLGTAYRYRLEPKGNGYYTCTVEQPASYAKAIEAVSELVAEIQALPTDADKVRAINDVVCDRLTYQSSASAMPNKLFTTSGVLGGNCTSYAKNFQFLCDLVGIPCTLLYSENHSWNIVYVNNAWLTVDCTSNDVGDDVEYRSGALMLANDKNTVRIDRHPQTTAFVKELIVPGSTK